MWALVLGTVAAGFGCSGGGGAGVAPQNTTGPSGRGSSSQSNDSGTSGEDGSTASACTVPSPDHDWNFATGTADDTVGSANGTLSGGASITDGALIVGNGMYMSASIPDTITTKTLVAWVSVANLTQGGGSALTISNTSAFDGIIYNEWYTDGFGSQYQDLWMAGSEDWVRSNGLGPQQLTANTVTMVAISYGSDNSITVYGNGTVASTYTEGSLQTYGGGSSDVVIGDRWIDCVAAGMTNCFLTGSVTEAQIYNTALSTCQIQALYSAHAAVGLGDP